MHDDQKNDSEALGTALWQKHRRYCWHYYNYLYGQLRVIQILAEGRMQQTVLGETY